jgi:hypothetical protein
MMNSGDVSIWNEVVSISCEVLFRNFSGQIDKIEEPVNISTTLPKFKSETLQSGRNI